jgi:hypothetical protein
MVERQIIVVMIRQRRYTFFKNACDWSISRVLEDRAGYRSTNQTAARLGLRILISLLIRSGVALFKRPVSQHLLGISIIKSKLEHNV